MTIRIIGGGWYGCHIAAGLLASGVDVQLHESADQLFTGASGSNPARLHQGFHYPRSRLTRAACLDHAEKFEASYGRFCRTVPVNLYAVAARDSLVDFGTYRDTMKSSGVEFLTVANPGAYGLADVEGALLTGERHVVISQVRAHFAETLAKVVSYGRPAGLLDDPAYELTVDCTFCSLDAEAIDRYEPCLTVVLEGPSHQAVTIMDGPFPSIYPWDEAKGLLSLTSASLTPLSKTCRSWSDARQVLSQALADPDAMGSHAVDMLDQMARYWPAARDTFKIVDLLFSIRAMPRSGADARLVDVISVGDRALRVRAGKIDAVFSAEKQILERLAKCRH